MKEQKDDDVVLLAFRIPRYKRTRLKLLAAMLGKTIEEIGVEGIDAAILRGQPPGALVPLTQVLLVDGKQYFGTRVGPSHWSLVSLPENIDGESEVEVEGEEPLGVSDCLERWRGTSYRVLAQVN